MPVFRVDAVQPLIHPAHVRLHGDPAPRWPQLNAWHWRVLGLLLLSVAALGVYALLPARAVTESGPVVSAAIAGTQVAAPVAQEETADQKRERRRLRRLAQDALQPLAAQRKTLDSLHPQYWNAAGNAAAEQLLHQSEQAYLAERYVAAADGYRASFKAYVALIAEGRALRARALVQARQAIDSSQPENAQMEAAAKALRTAEQISKGPDAAALARRFAVLPSVLAHIDRGIAAQAIEDLEMAHVSFSEALRLDPATARARAELAKVDQQRARQRFMSVMNRGFSALQQAQFDAARTTFQQASAYQPGSVTTAVALQEVSASSLVDELQRLQTQADGLLREEQFNAAADLYRKALAKDPSLTFAQQGIAQALARGDARRQIDDALAHPERLSSDEVLGASQRLLQKAQTLQGVGPQLAQRRRELEVLLSAAARDVTVELRSDNQTQLRVFRIGVIGRVTSHKLTLRPGRYTIIGTRDGYRDIRQDVDVRAGMDPVDVRCREPI